LRARSNITQGTLDYYNNGVYKYLKWLSLPVNPSTAFRNYTILYMPTYFSYYMDGSLLGSFNKTTATGGLPNSTMSITLYVSAASDSPKATDAMYVQSVSYTMYGGTTATC
jgi:hypothetical protein